MAPKMDALVLDDVMVTREGLVVILNQIENVTVARVCLRPEDALEEVRRRHYDLAMVNLQLGNQNGILLGRLLLELDPELKVMIYSSEASIVIAAEVYRHEFLEPTQQRRIVSGGTASVVAPANAVGIGLHGYTMLKNITPEQLARNLEILRTQGSVIDPEIMELLTERLNRYRLTPRELQCSELIGAGKSNREIAEQLGITRQAVENLINSLYHKLAITGEPKDPGRRVLLALTMQRWRGLNHPDK